MLFFNSNIITCNVKLLYSRLAAIDSVGGDTGCGKPQHRYATFPPRHHRLDFFYSNKII